MKINNLLDDIVKQRQDKCDHSYKDKIIVDNIKTFCGKCGIEEK